MEHRFIFFGIQSPIDEKQEHLPSEKPFRIFSPIFIPTTPDFPVKKHERKKCVPHPVKSTSINIDGVQFTMCSILS